MLLIKRLHRRGSTAVGQLRARRAGLRRGITVGPKVFVGAHAQIWCAPGGSITLGSGVTLLGHASVVAHSGACVELGANTFVAGYSVVAARDRVVIGRDCMLAEFVAVRDHDHDTAYPPLSGRMLSEPIEIGDRVWVAAKASVGRGVTIGNDAVIAAHAFVNSAVPSEALAGGVPARVLRRHIKGDLRSPTPGEPEDPDSSCR